MSLQDYRVDWSDALVARVETHLRDLHAVIHQYYEEAGYDTAVELRSGGEAKGDGEHEDSGNAASPSVLDVVSPTGSFLHRTCVHASPFANLHAARGVGADLVVTMPTEKCSQADLQAGRYLECRQAFLEEIEGFLGKRIRGAEKRRRSRSATADRSNGGADGAKTPTAADAAASDRLSRMCVCRMPIHGCYGNGAKEILRVRFRRRRRCPERDADGGAYAYQSNPFETFFVDLHFRPALSSGRVTKPAAARKHPYYSYLLLEDYAMPMYLKRIHSMCVEADGLRRALVILKCWAHHVGLMAATSGHQESLNGFVLACMLLKLREDGIISNTTGEENAVRAVWIRLSHAYFLPSADAVKKSGIVVPAAEERGEVAVLRLSGEVMNVLFRSSAEFFRNVVQRAAEEALTHPLASGVLSSTPFQQLQLRYDVAFRVCNALTSGSEEEAEEGAEGGGAFAANVRAADAIKKSGVLTSPLVRRVKEVCTDTLKTALGNRASFVSAWPVAPDTVQVIVQLTSESEGRSHLTRGPAIEDTEAVAAFNAFWGADRTSTRQFPDGAIYRCVLWSFPEVVGACTTTALSASRVLSTIAEYALRRHASPRTEVRALLGGLEGFLAERIGAEWRDAAHMMQRSLREASLEIQKVVADIPRSVLPCKVADFCVIAASERGTEVFPVRPHLALTHMTDTLETERYAGLSTAATAEPIHCVMSIDDKGKIPDTLEAIALMKGAICAQLAKYVNQHYQPKPSHGGGAEESAEAVVIQAFASSQSVDLIHHGYLFRVYIAHYREVSLLRALQREAEAKLLEQKLFWSAQHARLVSSLSYGHHSYANAVRLAKRWMSAMMLYEFVLPEAVELLVANAYLRETGVSTSTSTSGATSTIMGAPRTAVGGFIAFIQLLASHDWRQPLVLPFTDDDKDPTTAARTLLRKPAEHQAMFIAAPYAPMESPFTFNTPRPMIQHRLVQLAKGVLSLLMHHLSPYQHASHATGNGAETAVEQAMFASSPIAFDFHMRFHPQLVLQPDRSLLVRLAATGGFGSCDGEKGDGSHGVVAGGTSAADASGAVAGEAARVGAAQSRTLVRIRQLDELDKEQSREYIAALVEREPAAYAVRTLRAALRDKAMVFYDALAPEAVYIVGVTGAPQLKASQAVHSEVLRISRGALLPASPSAFTRPAAASATAAAAAAPAGDASSSGAKKTKVAKGQLDAHDAEALMAAAMSKHEREPKRTGGRRRDAPPQGHGSSGSNGAATRKRARTEEAGQTDKPKSKSRTKPWPDKTK